MTAGAPERGEVAVAYAVVSAQTAPARPDPLMFLMGGNGAGLRVLTRQGALLRELAIERDVILIDHRGSGFSRPLLGCPDLGGAEAIAANLEKQRACRLQLQQQGIDIDAFSPSAAARDVQMLRRLLGIHRWNVYAISYGTAIAHRLIRIDDAAIHSLIMDGVYGAGTSTLDPTTLAESLADVFTACAEDAACRGAFPRLQDDLVDALLRLSSVPAAKSDRPTRFEFMDQILIVMADESSRRHIPLAIHQAALGNLAAWRALRPAPDAPAPGAPQVSDRDPALTFFASVCREDFARKGQSVAPFAARHKLPNIITTSLRLDPSTDWLGFCTTFNFAGAPDDEVTPATTRVPTLLLNGELDMQTQLRESRAAERFLLDVRHIEVHRADRKGVSR
jgi:pimeloyl-ACP methyl ester carboxylesterase